MSQKSVQPTTTKIPKLRFPGFEGAWEEKVLSNILSVIVDNRGKTPPTGDSGIPLLETNSLGKKQINYSKVTKYVSDRVYNTWFRKHLQPGDVLFSTVGVTALCALYEGRAKAVVAQNIVGLRAKNDSSDFLFYLLTQKKNNHQFKRIEMGAVQPSVKVSQMVNIKFLLPPLPEQKKIAEFLSVLDEWTQNLWVQKESLEVYKKGLMQKLFSQEIRFKDENGKDFPAWEEKKLRDLLDYEQPTDYIVESTEYNDKNGTPVLTAGKTFILGYTDEANGVYQQDDLPVIIFDDFTTASQLVNFPFKVKSSAMKILKARKGVDIKFIYEAMQFIQYEIGGHGRHWISKYSHLKVLIPTFEEQQKIADFLTSLDNLIESKQRQIIEAETWKKGLTQELFV